MTTTTPTTAAELYAASGTFRAAVTKWVADRRCPLELGDFLDEHGLPAPADCARWCAACPDRRRWSGPALPPCGPFPTPDRSYDHPFYYWYRPPRMVVNFCDCVPEDNTGGADFSSSGQRKNATPELAILWLLDTWRVA